MTVGGMGFIPERLLMMMMMTTTTAWHYQAIIIPVYSLGLEFCMFVAGWRHALLSEWPRFYYHYYIPELQLRIHNVHYPLLKNNKPHAQRI